MLQENERNVAIADFFTSGGDAVKQIIPLGAPRHPGTDNKPPAFRRSLSLSQETPVKPGNLQKLSNPVPKRALPLKSPELEPKGKTVSSSPLSLSRATGDRRHSVPIPHVSEKKQRPSVLLPPFKVTKDGSPSLVCHRKDPSPSSVGAPRREKDSRIGPKSNGHCGSKTDSSPHGTTPGDGRRMSGHPCVKRKGEQVVENGKEGKRPCPRPGGPETGSVLSPRPSDKGAPKLLEASVPKCHRPARSPASTPKPSPATPSRQLHARPGPEQPRREGKEGTKLLYGRIVPRSPLPDKGGPKDSSPLQRSARRVLIVDTLNGLSRHVSPSRPSRANQLQAEEVSSTSNESSVPSTVSAAKVGPKHHDMSTSPPVRLASGVDDRSNVSPLPGAGLLDSVEDGALSDLELEGGAFVGGGSSSSSDSEDEPLLSLQEILDRSVRPPDTPDKSAFPEPPAPSHRPPLPGKSRPVIYKNTLEQMLKEKEENQRLKDIELKVLVSCKEDLLKLADEEDCDVIAEGDISQEHRAILKRFSVVSNGIPDVHPGEEVFVLSNFGRLFNQHSLDLRKCTVTPQNAAQKTLLQASPDELLFLIGTGLLLKAYRSSPCQPAVTRWLFQMMSVHLDRKASTEILRSMKDIALIAADQIVVNNNKKFMVWTPSVQDVALVFLNMGVPFVTLFPLEILQPTFSEGDILQSTDFLTEDVGSRNEHKPKSFPEHNFENVIKYMALCMALCSRAYSDQELLLLLTVVCRVSLETRLQLLPTEDVCWLLHHLVNNIREWDSKLPQICLALVDLTEDHHNLRWLVQLLPDHRRGKQLRKHLSVSIISKLLNHRCTYKPVDTEFKLSALRRYLPRMRPSSLLSVFFSVKRKENQGEEEDFTVSQDQQAYYLCYSLLALANEASNFDTFPSDQKHQLKLLSAELEKHIKCDIREGEQWLYRSKVKDFVARIYTRWQVLLHKSKPTQGKLHDYWQPLPEDMVTSSQGSVHSETEAEAETETNPVDPSMNFDRQVTTQPQTDVVS